MTGTIHPWIPELTALCREASAVILSYYQSGSLPIEHKDNNTPLTQADLAAHHFLAERLPHIADIPVISEEGAHHTAAPRYWLIDPIDGTTEFIRGSGQFCILITLIDAHRPVLAMIYAPTSHTYWYASLGQGSYKCTVDGTLTRLSCRTTPNPPTLISHNFPKSQRLKTFWRDTFGADAPCQFLGSALKFCAIAESQADIYIKPSSATCEWDIAAGDLLLHEAGGGICFADGSLPRYGVSATLINPPFLAYSRLPAARQQQYLQHLRQYLASGKAHV